MSILTPDWSLQLTTPPVEGPVLKAIAFQVQQLHLAFFIEVVDKVLKPGPIYTSGLNPIGITQVDQQEITVVDLQQRLFQTSTLQGAEYLIVVRRATGERYGVVSPTVPNLLEIPVSALQALPESYRQADTLGIASHVAILPPSVGSLTLFLLDVNQL